MVEIPPFGYPWNYRCHQGAFKNSVISTGEGGFINTFFSQYRHPSFDKSLNKFLIPAKLFIR